MIEGCCPRLITASNGAIRHSSEQCMLSVIIMRRKPFASANANSCSSCSCSCSRLSMHVHRNASKVRVGMKHSGTSASEKLFCRNKSYRCRTEGLCCVAAAFHRLSRELGTGLVAICYAVFFSCIFRWYYCCSQRTQSSYSKHELPAMRPPPASIITVARTPSRQTFCSNKNSSGADADQSSSSCCKDS